MMMSEFGTDSYRRNYSAVYRFVRRRSRTAEDAEDLTQEVFEAASAALAEARLSSEPELAWLYTVARRRLIQSWRRQRPTSTISEDAEAPPTPEAVYGPRIVNVIAEGIHRLPRTQRRVVVLKLFEGRSFTEISKETGASEEACRMRLSRALTTLRRQLEQEGISP